MDACGCLIRTVRRKEREFKDEQTMTHKERILKAIRGEMADRLAFAPRLDLWHSANARAGTLPPRYKDSTPDQIARAEGWALHKINP